MIWENATLKQCLFSTGTYENKTIKRKMVQGNQKRTAITLLTIIDTQHDTQLVLIIGLHNKSSSSRIIQFFWKRLVCRVSHKSCTTRTSSKFNRFYKDSNNCANTNSPWAFMMQKNNFSIIITNRPLYVSGITLWYSIRQ